MGANAGKLEPGKEQTTPKSLIHQHAISEPAIQETYQDNPRTKQLKKIKEMADASPQTEKLRSIQAMASQQAAQRKKQIPINNGEHLENKAVSKQVTSQLISPQIAVQKAENENSPDIQEETQEKEKETDEKPVLSVANDAVSSEIAAANTKPDESKDKPSEESGEEITNSYNKSGFITEKASLRKTEVVNTIIESNKKDKKNASKIIKSGL